jgi:hypothetical protein
MLESLFFPVLLHILAAFGLLTYIATSSVCIYIAIVGQITTVTTTLAKFKVYYGVFSLLLWAGIFVTVTLLKIGKLLLL